MTEQQWTVVWDTTFVSELFVAPRQISTRFMKKCYPDLLKRAGKPDGNTIKKLRDFKFLFRYRLGAYRVIYRLDRKRREVHCISIGNRSSVYDKLGCEEDGGPGGTVILEGSQKEFERKPNADDHEKRLEDLGRDTPPHEDRPLPQEPKLDEELLRNLNIEPKHWPCFMAASTDGEFLECLSLVSDEKGVRLLGILFPQKINERIASPPKIANQDEIERVLSGELDPEHLMFVPDPDQQEYLKRLERNGVENRPTGPWLVKGGPGSGKTLLALYAIRTIVEGEQASLFHPAGKSLRILLTTYTKSLAQTWKSYMTHLLAGRGKECVVHCKHFDSVVTGDRKGYVYPLAKEQKDKMKEVFAQARSEKSTFSFGSKQFEVDFLLEEIEWVIVGQGLEHLDEYLTANRSGRGRQLGSRQKEDVWNIWIRFCKLLEEDGKKLWGVRTLDALKTVKPSYDYIFIDEAQDLKLAGLRYLRGLCRSPTGIFITADLNQSIYGGGMPWKEVSADLSFAGKTKIFKTNHRNTVQIWDAIKPFVTRVRVSSDFFDGPGEERSDRDDQTLENRPYREGPEPLLVYYERDLAAAVGDTLHEMAISAQVPWKGAVVLVPSFNFASEIANGLPDRMNAKAMRSSSFDIEHNGVKVTTMHAAKGMGFPVVVVAGLEKGVFPLTRAKYEDSEMLRASRLLFVACSRAEKELALVAPIEKLSPLLERIDTDHWRVAPTHK